MLIQLKYHLLGLKIKQKIRNNSNKIYKKDYIINIIFFCGVLMLSQYFLNYGNSLFKNKQDSLNYKRMNYSIKICSNTKNFKEIKLTINKN